MLDARRIGAAAATVLTTIATLSIGVADAGPPCTLDDAGGDCQLPDQLGHGQGGTLAATSDPDAGDFGFFVAENFSPVANSAVTAVCWWGIYFDFTTQLNCGPGGGNNVTVTYYENGPGVPGAVLAGPFTVFPTVQATGLQVNGIDEYEFTAIHPLVIVDGGACYWIEIANSAGATDCTWLWSTAPPGDGHSAQDTDGDGYEDSEANDYDLAFCLDIDIDLAACAPPANDDCADATNIDNGTFAFSTVNATTGAQSEPLCNVNGDNQVRSDIWYRYISDCNVDVTVDLCASTFNTKLAVYEGFCPVAAAQAIACNDDACGLQSQLVFAATAGQAYYLRVGGFMGEQGEGAISVSSNCLPPPGNNNFATSQPLAPGSVAFSTLGATTTGPAESCPVQNDIWYRLVDGCDETVHISVSGADFNPQIAVYGSTCPGGDGTAIACGPSVQFEGPLFSFFRVRVGSSDGSTGTGTLEITCGPATGGCPGDTNADDDVDVNDLNNVILDWGTDGSGNGGDITDASGEGPPDGIVNVNDLNAVIVNWGPC